MQIEYNRFFNRPDGGKSEHVKVICDSYEALETAIQTVNGLFTVDLGDIPFEEPPPRTPARPAPASQREQARGMACGMCGGDTYDNRAKKAKGEYGATSPDFTCKDKSECNARMWLNKDGTEGDWKYPKV